MKILIVFLLLAAGLPAAALPESFHKCLPELLQIADHDDRMRALAKKAGLHYVEEPGGRSGAASRREALGVPPGWREVWINPDAKGHIQATGHDQKGRLQYVYHPKWIEARDALKFQRLADFGAALPKLRAALKRDLAGPSLSKERVLAAMVRIVEKSVIRVGSAEYAKENGSFGLTTLQPEHLTVRGNKIKLSFPGKSHVFHELEIEDAEAAAVLRECHRAGGPSLFVYKGDDGALHALDASALNSYLHAAAGPEFSIKDFRTWYGSVEALKALRAGDDLDDAVKKASEKLGNTPAVCRQSYIHPAILAAAGGPRIANSYRGRGQAAEKGLDADERALLRLVNDGN